MGTPLGSVALTRNQVASYNGDHTIIIYQLIIIIMELYLSDVSICVHAV